MYQLASYRGNSCTVVPSQVTLFESGWQNYPAYRVLKLLQFIIGCVAWKETIMQDVIWITHMTSDKSYCTWSVCFGYRKHFWKNSKVCKSYIVALRLLRTALQYFSFCLQTAKHWYVEPIPVPCLCFLSKKASFETQNHVREGCLEVKVGIQHFISSLLRSGTS